MSNWTIFLITAFILGIVISSIMIIRQNSKMKLPESIKEIIALKEKGKERNKTKNSS